MELWYILGRTKNEVIFFGLELPMHQSGSNWTHKCIPCNNILVNVWRMVAKKLVFDL